MSKLQRRSKTTAKQASLSLRHWLKRGTLWTDYGYIKLPFHGDGDLQELYYHLNVKEWWENETREIAPYVKPGHSIVDVGANLGFMSGIFSKLTGSAGHIYSFEPSPATYAKLQETVRANHYSNVITYNVGCGTEESTMTLFCPSSSGNATLLPGENLKRSPLKEQSVRIVRLDDFLSPVLDRLDFLKIDTEGFEPQVLGGAIGLLKRFKPVIYIELGSLYSDSSVKALEILRDLGYTLPRLEKMDTAFSGENFFALPPN